MSPSVVCPHCRAMIPATSPGDIVTCPRCRGQSRVAKMVAPVEPPRVLKGEGEVYPPVITFRGANAIWLALAGLSLVTFVAVAMWVSLGANATPAVGASLLMAAVWLAACALYFAPGIVAASRGHPNTLAIWALNTFAGCTAIGWAAALAWALISLDEKKVR